MNDDQLPGLVAPEAELAFSVTRPNAKGEHSPVVPIAGGEFDPEFGGKVRERSFDEGDPLRLAGKRSRVEDRPANALFILEQSVDGWNLPAG
jgi:hypothetical protein